MAVFQSIGPRLNKQFLGVQGWLLAVLGVVACVLSGFHQRGQDVDYDQLNYHFYSAYAFLHHRLTQDAAPAGLIHSYFNPLAYVPFYWLVGHLSARPAIFILGVWHGFNAWLVLLIAWRVTGGLARSRRIALASAAVAISLASPMALAEWASSFSDITTSLLILGGVAALIRAAPEDGWRGRAVWMFAASGLIGLAIGLKLTNAIYAPAVLVCCFIGSLGLRAKLQNVLAAAGGGACGVLATGGFWYLRLWQVFRDPVFPYYDAVFKSPELAPVKALHGVSFFDRRFLPGGIWQGLGLPFRWLHVNTTTCELPFRDIRFALLLCLLLIAVCLGVLRTRLSLPRPSAAQGRLLAFFVVTFAVWAYQFGIQRYIVGLEFLAGPAIIVGLLLILPPLGASVASVCIAGLCLATVVTPNFGRIKAHRNWYEMQLPEALQKPALVFVQGNALSYVVPFLPAGSHAVGLTQFDVVHAGTGNFADRLVRRVLAEAPALPVYVVFDEDLWPTTRADLASYGLGELGRCVALPNRADIVGACAVLRVAEHKAASLALRPGDTLHFGKSMVSAAAFLTGWHIDSGWGVVGGGYRPSLQLRLDPAFGPGPFRLTIGIFGLPAGPPDATISLRANGRLAGTIGFGALSASKTLQGCIGPEALDATREITLVLDSTVQFSTGLTSLTMAAGCGG